MGEVRADNGLRMLVDRLEFSLMVLEHGGTVDWGGVKLDEEKAKRWYRANVLRLAKR